VNRTFLALCAAAMLPAARASITVPGANGSDGALTVPDTGVTTIDLSQAPTGVWDQNNAANAGKGVYDPDKWAVVFKYSSVNIPSGATVNFTNNASRAPVVWLVNGNVTINGTINVGAESSGYGPGPGGFRTGQPFNMPALGPGAGDAASDYGGYATAPTGGRTYGNAAILPLIGGSAGTWVGPGSSGGGAILIAATGSINVAGFILANPNYGSGSGGAIRLVADAISGAGTLNATSSGSSGVGRIRLEAGNIAPGLLINPDPSAARPGNPAVIWPPATQASVRIVSIASVPTPADPLAAIGSGADVPVDMITGASAFPVVIETKNVATTSVVNLRVAPPGSAATLVKATLLDGDVNLAHWTVNIGPPAGTTALQVRVEAPQ
jgi:plastocyanin